MLDIKITQNISPKPKPEGPLGFGRIFTDHMFIMDYMEGEGWHDPRIVPYADLSLPPSCMAFHYGQTMFEGMKAYRGEDGSVFLFRPEKNGQRANQTNDRLRIPQIPVEDFVQAVKALVRLDAAWVPTDPDTALYIRPFVIAADSYLGVAPSKRYLFLIICSPSGMYYSEGLKPIRIWVEDDYVRAVRGGVGFTKTGGNYAASLAAQEKANKEGYAQVLWLDGVQRRYVEEVGSMNIFFKIGGKVITPALNGSILAGVTRDSVITLCRDWGLEVEEKPVTIEDLLSAQRSGMLEEVFGTGTAAVITPVGILRYQDDVFPIADGETGTLSKKLYDTISGMQRGTIADKYGWSVVI